MTDEPKPGYKHPPKATRFKAGASGNPRGRPKGQRNLKTDLASLLSKPVLIRENGKQRRASRQEAMLLALYAKAMQGDTKASNQLFTMLAKAEIRDTTEPAPVTDNDRAIVEAFLRRNSAPANKDDES